MKEYYAPELSCKYRWDAKVKCLEYAGQFRDGTFDDWEYVEEDLVGEERVVFLEHDTTLSEVYRIVEGILA